MRTPTGRYLERERKQQRALRENQRAVCFAGAFSTDIRELTSMPHNDPAVNPFADACRGDGTYDSEQFYVTEHDHTPAPCVIWKALMQTHFKEEQLMDLPLTAKRIAIDEVDRKMDYVEHQFVQGAMEATMMPGGEQR